MMKKKSLHLLLICLFSFSYAYTNKDTGFIWDRGLNPNDSEIYWIHDIVTSGSLMPTSEEVIEYKYDMTVSESNIYDKVCIDKGGRTTSLPGHNPNPHGKYSVKCARSYYDYKKILSSLNFNGLEVLDILLNRELDKTSSLEKSKFETSTSYNKRLKKDKIKRNIHANEYLKYLYPVVYGYPLIKSIDYDAEKEVYFGLLQSERGNYSQKISIKIPIDIAEKFYYGTTCKFKSNQVANFSL